MKIETKFKIGQEVYVIFKEDAEIKLFKDTIDSIVIKKDKVVYFMNKICEEFNEDELVEYGNCIDLINKIDKLIN